MKTYRYASIAAAGLLLGICAGNAQTPAGEVRWWKDRGVVIPGSSYNPADNQSPVSLGQLKWTARQAALEIEQHSPRSVPDSVWTIINSWAAADPSNYAPALAGQAKVLADGLLGKFHPVGQPPQAYRLERPWTETAADDVNYSPLLTGQLKNIFDFNVYGAPEDLNPADGSIRHPVITEVVALSDDPDGGQAGGGTALSGRAGYIEVFNPTGANILLSDYIMATKELSQLPDSAGNSSLLALHEPDGDSNVIRWTGNPGGRESGVAYWRLPPVNLAAGAYIVFRTRPFNDPSYVPQGGGAAPARLLTSAASAAALDLQGRYHTAFTLSSSGSYLALYQSLSSNAASAVKRVQHFYPSLPRATKGRGFGITRNVLDGQNLMLSTGHLKKTGALESTPGANNPDEVYRVDPVTFTGAQAEGGMYLQTTLQMGLDCADAGAEIYFTLDGSEPEKPDTGDVDGPSFTYTRGSGFTITSLPMGGVDHKGLVRVVNSALPGAGHELLFDRAVTIKAVARDKVYSKTVARTWIFPERVPFQERPTASGPRASAEEYPATIETLYWGTVAFDYAMAPALATTPAARTALKDQMMGRPAVNISLPLQDLVDTDSANTYGDKDALFEDYEWGDVNPSSVRCTVEWMDGTTNRTTLSVPARVEVAGESSTDWGITRKKSLKVRFGTHGDSGVRFNFFDGAMHASADGETEWVTSIALKSGGHDTWAIPWWGQLINSYLSDAFTTDITRAMTIGESTPGLVRQPRVRTVNVFLNGLYWGVYFLHERPDEGYLAKELGVTASECVTFDDWDVPLFPPSIPAHYNLQNYADYALTYQFAAPSGDWPTNNVRLTGLSGSSPNYHHFTWGAEFNAFDEPVSYNMHQVMTGGGIGADLYMTEYNDWVAARSNDPQATTPFREMLIARLKKHARDPGGVLLPANISARFSGWREDFGAVELLEAARWGDADGVQHYPEELHAVHDDMADYMVEKLGYLIDHLRDSETGWDITEAEWTAP